MFAKKNSNQVQRCGSGSALRVFCQDVFQLMDKNHHFEGELRKALQAFVFFPVWNKSLVIAVLLSGFLDPSMIFNGPWNR